VLLPEAVYKSGLRAGTSMTAGIRNYHIYNQYVVRVQKRDGLKEFLTKNNVGNEIYYPVPFHLQECFSYLGHKKGNFPISEGLADTTLALPVFPELAKEQIEYVVQKINEFITK
jgi:dTDP-4-amino-4,6-dideoxygalactose transaminase